MQEVTRCPWSESDPLSRAYHDSEWGVRQLHDERGQFEFLTLELMQCGLSWRTVLSKREAMRQAFDNFEAQKIAAYDEEKLAALMQAPGIIHSAPKLRAMIHNARLFLGMQQEFGSFDAWFWRFTDGQTVRILSHARQMPAKSALSERMSAALKKRGFKFLGPVVIYSHMQAVGMINDHQETCFACKLLGGAEFANEDAYEQSRKNL